MSGSIYGYNPYGYGYTPAPSNSALISALSNPQSVNPLSGEMNALQLAALLRYLQGNRQGTPTMAQWAARNQAPASTTPYGGAVANMPVVPVNPQTGQPATSPQTMATPGRTSSPGWFMPTSTALYGGNSVYRSPSGQPYIDTSAGTLPYQQWQWPASGTTNAS